jgi:hypothetical protein
MAKRKTRRKKRKYKTEALLADFRRLSHKERFLALKRLEQRLRRAGLLVIVLLATLSLYLLAQLH